MYGKFVKPPDRASRRSYMSTNARDLYAMKMLNHHRNFSLPTSSLKREVSSQSSVADISIPGVTKIFSKNYPIPLRVFWTVAVTICLILTIFQITLRITYFFGNPVSIIVENDRDANLLLPNFTICPIHLTEFMFWYHNNLSAASDLQDFSFFDEAPFENVEEFWKLLHFPNNSIRTIVPCSRVFDQSMACKFRIKFMDSVSFRGICRTYYFPDNFIYQGTDTYITFLYNHTAEVSIQPKYEEFFRKLRNFNTRWSFTAALDNVPKFSYHHSFFHDTVINKKTVTLLNVKKKSFNAINRPQRRCVADPVAQKCYNDCTRKRLNDYMPCRLPFMDDKYQSYCEWSEMLKALQVLWELYRTRDMAKCGCPRICNEVMYSFSRSVTQSFSETMTVLDLNFADNVKDVSQEVNSYGFSALVSDIGGNLGLFLGCCCLSVLEVFETIIIKITSYRRQNHIRRIHVVK